MNKVIISVRLASSGEFDLEFVSTTPIGIVISQLVMAQGWDTTVTTYEIQYEGKTIHPSETLAKLDLWNGTELVLHPRHSSLTPSSTANLKTSDNLPSFLAGLQSAS